MFTCTHKIFVGKHANKWPVKQKRMTGNYRLTATICRNEEVANFVNYILVVTLETLMYQRGFYSKFGLMPLSKGGLSNTLLLTAF